jgi:uncharacterized protein
MMRTVIDCNIIISAGISYGNCYQVIREIITKHDNFISKPILLEYKRVIFRDNFINYKSKLISILELICQYSHFTAIDNYDIKYSLPDKDDEIYLKTALKSEANYLITCNIKDFPGRKYNETNIITAKDFLELEDKNHKIP